MYAKLLENVPILVSSDDEQPERFELVEGFHAEIFSKNVSSRWDAFSHKNNC